MAEPKGPEREGDEEEPVPIVLPHDEDDDGDLPEVADHSVDV